MGSALVLDREEPSFGLLAPVSRSSMAFLHAALVARSCLKQYAKCLHRSIVLLLFFHHSLLTDRDRQYIVIGLASQERLMGASLRLFSFWSCCCFFLDGFCRTSRSKISTSSSKSCKQAVQVSLPGREGCGVIKASSLGTRAIVSGSKESV